LGFYISIWVHRYIFKLKDEDENKAGVCFTTGFIVSAIITIFLFNYAFGFGDLKSELSYSYNIYAIQDTSMVEGRRYYFKENMEYFYLADYNDGKKMYSVSSNSSYIVENDATQPHIEVYKKVIANPNAINKYTIDIVECEYKIVVPKQTLEENFKIDLKK
jgi:hypothetical protein